VIELYAITQHPGPPLPTLAPLRAVVRHGLAAICAPATEAEISPDGLWRHEEVVEALMHDRDVLPVRFGTVLQNEAAAASVLTDRRGELARALSAIRGSVEISVRVLATAEKPAPPAPRRSGNGAEYLRARAQTVAGQERVARAISDPLVAAARCHVKRRTTVPGELLRAAYLVRREDVGAFVRLVGELQDDNPTLRLLCTGPWPPYSFTEQ
jgi:Gas vesicle synthesis protein GvpL/GvpF